MRATLHMARSAASWGVETASAAFEDTVRGLTDVIVPVYIAGLILSIPFGWLGDLAMWGVNNIPYQNEFVSQLGEFCQHLGQIPAALAMVMVGYYYWQIIGRGMTAEAAVHALPNFIQRRVARWSLPRGTMHRDLRTMASVGMWGSLLLWVPVEFHVSRYIYHYLAALGVSITITLFVASSPSFEKFWRKFYGANLGVIAVVHGLGLMGFALSSIWGYITNFKGGHMDSGIAAGIMALALLVGVILLIASRDKQHGHA